MSRLPPMLLCLALLAAPGLAQPSDGPCRADMREHCADVERGGGAMRRCLREHQEELAPACRDHLAERHERMKERADRVREACAGDIAKHCPGREPGKGGLIGCLREHEADLSTECRAALPDRGAPR